MPEWYPIDRYINSLFRCYEHRGTRTIIDDQFDCGCPILLDSTMNNFVINELHEKYSRVKSLKLFLSASEYISYVNCVADVYHGTCFTYMDSILELFIGPNDNLYDWCFNQYDHSPFELSELNSIHEIWSATTIWQWLPVYDIMFSRSLISNIHFNGKFRCCNSKIF